MALAALYVVGDRIPDDPKGFFVLSPLCYSRKQVRKMKKLWKKNADPTWVVKSFKLTEVR